MLILLVSPALRNGVVRKAKLFRPTRWPVSPDRNSRTIILLQTVRRAPILGDSSMLLSGV